MSSISLGLLSGWPHLEDVNLVWKVGPSIVSHGLKAKCIVRGVHPPKAMMIDAPPFQISSLLRIFSDSGEKFTDFFPQKCMFHPRKFPMTFLVINWLWISLLLSLKRYISPYFAKFISPYFEKFPWFRKIYLFFAYFTCFSFPPTSTMMHLCITQYTYWTPLCVMAPGLKTGGVVGLKNQQTEGHSTGLMVSYSLSFYFIIHKFVYLWKVICFGKCYHLTFL